MSHKTQFEPEEIRMIQNMTPEKFEEYLNYLCAQQAMQVDQEDETNPIKGSDYIVYKTMRENGILRKITPQQLAEGSTLDTCGDDRRVWECYGHIHRGTASLQNGPSKFFPFSGPGGPLLAHPKISAMTGHDYFGMLKQKIKMTYVARGRKKYKGLAHAPCGVAGMFEMTFDEVVECMIELCFYLEEACGGCIPDFTASPLLHVDRRGHMADPREWMRTYRIIPEQFYAWRNAGSPLQYDASA